MIDRNKKFEKAKAGLLLLASPRFKNLGEGLERGTYNDRKNNEVEEIIGALRHDINIVAPGIIYTREDLLRGMDLFCSEKVDFVIAEFLSWSEDFAWVRFLRDIPEIPILFLNPVKEKMKYKNTIDEDDFIDFLCSGTLVGSLEASGSISRLCKDKIITIVGSRKELVSQSLSFAKIAQTRNVLLQANFGLLSNFNELMWSTYIDPYNLFTRIGPELRFISYSTLAEEIHKVTDSEVKTYQKDLISTYSIAEDVDLNLLYESVRASIGLAKLSENLCLDAMIFNDVDPVLFKLIGLRPGFYHPSFNDNLSVMVPEADVGGGVIAFILKMISKKFVNFIEPFHIESADNTFAAGHAGPNDHNDPKYKQNVKIARDVRFAKTNYKYAGAPFAWYRISPGRKTMAHFSQKNGGFKLVCTIVDSLEGEHLFASYSHSIFKPLIPVTELFKRILNIGTTQHFAIVDGDYRHELSILSKIMKFEYIEIN